MTALFSLNCEIINCHTVQLFCIRLICIVTQRTRVVDNRFVMVCDDVSRQFPVPIETSFLNRAVKTLTLEEVYIGSINIDVMVQRPFVLWLICAYNYIL